MEPKWNIEDSQESLLEPPTRRRVHYSRPEQNNATTIDFPEPDFGDPEYLELLKVYDESDSDGKEEDLKYGDGKPRRTRSYVTQGSMYMLVIGIMGLFMLFIQYYNMKQLERLKVEYGLDVKKPEPDMWWKTALIYRIYVQSFKDSDGDGIGDITGIRQHIDHLHYLRIDAVLLSPIFESPFLDQGRDVTSFDTIDPRFGTMEDFEELVVELQKLGIKVLLEFLPNHTSKQHKWFRQSRRGGANNQFKDYYMWHSGTAFANGTRKPPSNWVSRYGGSAWTWDEERFQFYYHYYHESMPDLNHRNPQVREALMDVVNFWLERGIDGILLDDVHMIFESEELSLDEPASEREDIAKDSHAYLDHIYTEDQPDIHEYISTWRDVVETFALRHKKKMPVLVSVEDDSIADIAKYYFTGADGALGLGLVGLEPDCDGGCIQERLDTWFNHVPTENDILWMLGSADYGRGIQYKGVKYQQALNMLMLLLPGAAVTYYGDEIAMEMLDLDYSQTRDLKARTAGPGAFRSVSRDPSRGPMLWSGERGAGFTEGQNPWLPLHPSYKRSNVEVQRNDQSGRSSLQLYQRLASLRKQPSFQHGKIQYSIITNHVISFMRYADNNAPYLVAINIGTETVAEDFTLTAGVLYGKVVAHARGDVSAKSDINEGHKVNLESLTLSPGEGAVVLLLMED